MRAATMSRPILLKANILSSQLLDPAEISREKQTASSLVEFKVLLRPKKQFLFFAGFQNYVN